MDVVYVIGTGSKFGNEELRYSLRSICRFAQNLGEVYIVGDVLPPFINPDSVHYIHWPDLPGELPEKNVGGKILQVFQQTQLQQFLLSSDDHFFIKPVDFDQWPVLYKGKRMPGVKDVSTGVFGDKRYTECMVRTSRYMELLGLDLKYYEGHTNKLYTREAWDWFNAQILRENFPYGGHMFGVPSLNSLMGASIMHLHPDYPCQYRKDIKLHHLDRMSDWVQLIGAHSFSIYDSAWNTGVFDFLSYLFPEKCRFEE